MEVTYWCWYGSKIVGITRGPPGMSDLDVQVKLVNSGDPEIFCDRPLENPTERRSYIMRSRVVTYPGEH